MLLEIEHGAVVFLPFSGLQFSKVKAGLECLVCGGTHLYALFTWYNRKSHGLSSG